MEKLKIKKRKPRRNKYEKAIREASNWLENNMHDWFDGDSEFAVASDFIKIDKFIENFIEHMKQSL